MSLATASQSTTENKKRKEIRNIPVHRTDGSSASHTTPIPLLLRRRPKARPLNARVTQEQRRDTRRPRPARQPEQAVRAVADEDGDAEVEVRREALEDHGAA